MPLDESADSPLLFKNAKAFEAWLKKHHATSTGLWLKIAKRGADDASVTYLEAVDIALCAISCLALAPSSDAVVVNRAREHLSKVS